MTATRRFLSVAAAVIFVLCCVSCAPVQSTAPAASAKSDQAPIQKQAVQAIGDAGLQDNAALYESDDEDSVVTMYLTVRRGNKAEGTDHSWEEVNQYSVYHYERTGEERYMVEGLLQVGDENGPTQGELGYGLRIPNAVVSIRGATSSVSPQKSYKIELKKNGGEWRGQQTIALNKHVFDGLRIRNKLAFDLLKQIPNTISLRTQFVHLYVKDETKPTPDTAFADYGLFTQVELPNKRFLKNHGLDSQGQLYKAVFFEFERYPDVLKLKTDWDYDAAEFQKYLEIKGNDDHSKLLAMLDALNDPSKPIEEVFGKYFDEENYFTWLAFNIIMGDEDAEAQNYYLYSPLNSDKWYFISWDCDGILMRNSKRAEAGQEDFGFQSGISNFWGTVLNSRVLRQAKYRAKLDEKIQQLRAFLTPERIDELSSMYYSVTEPYYFAMPDSMHAPVTQEVARSLRAKLKDEVTENYERYVQSLKKPMPFYLYNPKVENGRLVFEWSAAYDFDEQDIDYTFELATDYLFTAPIVRKEGWRFLTIDTDMLAPGQYFVRIVAKNEDGETQPAMVSYETINGKRYYGTQCFYLLSDGSVELSYGE